MLLLNIQHAYIECLCPPSSPLAPVSRCVPFHAHTVIYRDIKTNGSLCFIKTGSSITQVSVFYFSYLTVPCGAAFKLSLSHQLLRGLDLPL